MSSSVNPTVFDPTPQHEPGDHDDHVELPAAPEVSRRRLVAGALGAQVTGSDRADSPYAERLREHGIAFPNDFRRNALAGDLLNAYGNKSSELLEAEAIRARVRAARAQLLKDGRWPGGGRRGIRPPSHARRAHAPW